MMLEIESKRCNPSIQQESYGDVKAIAFSFVKKHLFITVFSIYENVCKRLHLCG